MPPMMHWFDVFGRLFGSVLINDTVNFAEDELFGDRSDSDELCDDYNFYGDNIIECLTMNR